MLMTSRRRSYEERNRILVENRLYRPSDPTFDRVIDWLEAEGHYPKAKKTRVSVWGRPGADDELVKGVMKLLKGVSYEVYSKGTGGSGI